MRRLRWSCKSTGQLARELTRQGHPNSVDRLLFGGGKQCQFVFKTIPGSRQQMGSLPVDKGLLVETPGFPGVSFRGTLISPALEG